MSERQLLERSCLDEGSMSVPVNVNDIPQHWKEYACGGGAAFCNILISYPLNKLIFRQVSILFTKIFINKHHSINIILMVLSL